MWVLVTTIPNNRWALLVRANDKPLVGASIITRSGVAQAVYFMLKPQLPVVQWI
jgi:hypothetical protein